MILNTLGSMLWDIGLNLASSDTGKAIGRVILEDIAKTIPIPRSLKNDINRIQTQKRLIEQKRGGSNGQEEKGFGDYRK